MKMDDLSAFDKRLEDCVTKEGEARNAAMVALFLDLQARIDLLASPAPEGEESDKEKAERKKQCSEYKNRRSLVLSLSGDLQGNARVLYSDAGNWAIHFSNVRMGMSTFFLGIAWGAVVLNWDSYHPSLAWASWGVWIISGAFLAFFTWQTMEYSARQKRLKALLPTMDSKSAWRALQTRTRVFIWLPVAVYLLASVGYWQMHDAWSKFEKKPTGIEVSLEGETVSFEPVDLKPIREELKALRKENQQLGESIEEIRIKLETAN